MEGTMQSILKFATSNLAPTMIFIFGMAIVLRALIYWTVKREEWFAKEFEKRTSIFLEELEQEGHYSFYLTVKRLMEQTFYELFIMRSINKRRRHDVAMSFNDRLFLIQHGAAFMVRDFLKQIKYLKHGNHAPKMLEISKTVCQNNPCFNKVFGIVPLSINDVVNVLPNIFVIGGIFGTFLGIMDGLHSLTGMDIADVEGTQETMNAFLSHVAFSMSTSIVGIILSVSMTMINTVLNPEKLFVNIIERFENGLDVLWNRSDSNILPENIENFDANRDPAEALAESAVESEFKKSRFAKEDRSMPGEHLVKQAIEEIKDPSKVQDRQVVQPVQKSDEPVQSQEDTQHQAEAAEMIQEHVQGHSGVEGRDETYPGPTADESSGGEAPKKDDDQAA
jgi:hypothetical protein